MNKSKTRYIDVHSVGSSIVRGLHKHTLSVHIRFVNCRDELLRKEILVNFSMEYDLVIPGV